MTRKECMDVHRQRLLIYDKLKSMPPLSHYPDRTKQFNLEDSKVIQHILSFKEVRDLRAARVIFEHAARVDAILFDSASKLWSGNPKWQPRRAA